MFKSYSQMVGLDYLWFVLAQLIYDINAVHAAEEGRKALELEELKSSVIFTTMEVRGASDASYVNRINAFWNIDGSDSHQRKGGTFGKQTTTGAELPETACNAQQITR